VRTPEHEYSLELFSEDGARGGRHRLANDGSGEIIGCRGLTHEIDYADNVISLRTPRRCLDKPRWVKARIMNMVVVEGEEPTQYYIDNPRNDQAISEAFTKRLFPQ